MPVAAVVGAVVTMLEKADPGPIVAMLAPGAVLWHNNDAIEVDAAQGFERIGGLHALVGDVRIDVTHADEIDNGIVIRFVIGGVVKASGAALAVRNCLFVLLDGARITRVEEYLDPTFGAQLGVTA